MTFMANSDAEYAVVTQHIALTSQQVQVMGATDTLTAKIF